MRTLIIADGEGTRWGGHLGVPKHLAPFDGEPLIHRTIRQFSELGDVYVVTSDSRYPIPPAVQYAPTHNPDNFDADKFLNSQPLWNPDGRTVVAYGDVWFSDALVARISGFQKREWRLFARQKRSMITGTRWGECFAQSFWPEHHQEHYEALRKIVAAYGSGKIKRCGGWEHYQAMQGLPLGRHRVRGRFVEHDDWSDDFDYPEDYDRWHRRRSLLQRSSTSSARATTTPNSATRSAR